MISDRKASDIATGKWHGILASVGIERTFLTGKHGPCPICGGKDRFRFDDKNGRGTWICNKCGAGDGFLLLQQVKGWTFRECVCEVEKLAGTVHAIKSKDDIEEKRRMDSIRRIWSESVAVTSGDPVYLYLSRRCGVEFVPSCIRYHPALMHIDGSGEVTHHPAMIAVLTDASNKGVGIHRIYLDMQGNKATVDHQKKLLTGKSISGASVKLAKHSGVLGIAEGIETALAASVTFSVPVWSSISANGMEAWTPPIDARQIVIFGDNDASYTGQASSYALAKRLVRDGFSVKVKIPDQQGKDWADD